MSINHRKKDGTLRKYTEVRMTCVGVASEWKACSLSYGLLDSEGVLVQGSIGLSGQGEFKKAFRIERDAPFSDAIGRDCIVRFGINSQVKWIRRIDK